MLGKETLVAFMATSKPDAARAFFEGVLGLTFVGEHEHLVMFQSGAAQLMLQKASVVARGVCYRRNPLSVSTNGRSAPKAARSARPRVRTGHDCPPIG